MTRQMPATEWILTDRETQKRALRGMMKLRRLILETLGQKMGGRMLFSAFLRDKQAGLYLQSFIDAAIAMECEVVVRPISERKLSTRLALLKQERGDGASESEGSDNSDLIDPDDPEAEFKNRLLNGMVSPIRRAELEEVFRQARAA